MLTNKQSLILCTIVGVGFSFAGIFDLLKNYAISGILIILFLAVIVNILITLNKKHEKENDQ